MNIFVTGGTGFIGSYVVNELINNGHKVTILARNPKKIEYFSQNSSIEIVEGTLYDKDSIEKGLLGKDACIHIALGWGDTPSEMLEADTKPSLYIFETAAKLGVRHIIYTSSTAAIGELRPIMDEKTNVLPNDFYGATKAASEAYLNAISHYYNIRCNIIRPGYTFGNPVVLGAPMQPDSRFRDIVKTAENNEPIQLIKNDGTQFIWAGDLAKVYSAVLYSELDRHTFLALGAEHVTWERIAHLAVDILGSKSPIILEDKGWVEKGCLYDTSSIKEEFGFQFSSLDRIKEHISYIAKSS